MDNLSQRDPIIREIRTGKDSDEAETYVLGLAETSLLRPWCFVNPHYIKGKTKPEMCDILAIYEDDIIIFSIKRHSYPSTNDAVSDWTNWYKEALEKSANQLKGAKRTFLMGKTIYKDAKCTEPIHLPDIQSAKIYLIAVAFNCADACRRFFGDNNGSGTFGVNMMLSGKDHTEGLLLNNDRKEANPMPVMPFTVGQVLPEAGYIHIYEEEMLTLLVNCLDTPSEFIEYLVWKEKLYKDGVRLLTPGEENVLSTFLNEKSGMVNYKPEFEADFHWIEPTPPDIISIYQEELVKARYESIFWDSTIDFVHQTIRDKRVVERFGKEETPEGAEEYLGLMAREPRRARLFLTQLMHDGASRTQEGKNKVITVGSPTTPGLHYLFSCLRPDIPEDRWWMLMEATLHHLSKIPSDSKILAFSIPYLETFDTPLNIFYIDGSRSDSQILSKLIDASVTSMESRLNE